MKKLKELLLVFVSVTTCVVFVAAVYISVFWPQVVLGVKILWQILLVSFLSSLGIFIYPERAVSGKTLMLLRVLHYIEVNVVVLGCGIWFGWFYVDNLPMALGMLAVIALVFLALSVAMWIRGKQMADRMNERLKEYQEKEEE